MAPSVTSYIVILGVADLANARRLRHELINWNLKEEQAKEGKLEMQNYRDKPRGTNILFCSLFVLVRTPRPQQ